jgi:hypothetical protein
MDRDPIISRALDIIAENCAQNTDNTGNPFKFHHFAEVDTTEAEVMAQAFRQWLSLTGLSGNRLFSLFRRLIKYGDDVYIRDPETQEYYSVDIRNVTKVSFDDKQGKKICHYYIKNVELNLANKIFSPSQFYGSMFRSSLSNPAAADGLRVLPGRFDPVDMTSYTNSVLSGASATGEVMIPAEHVVHFSINSLSDFSSVSWPFGISILEKIYTTYRHKQLLEESVVVYTISRAPERLVFYIDTGRARGLEATRFVEQFKNEMFQRRIPNRGPGGTAVQDAMYDSLGINDNYYVPVGPDGRGTKIEQLPGGQALTDTGPLPYFVGQILRGLGIPPSYLPMGEDSTLAFNDGKVGTALIQEQQFTNMCRRFQSCVVEVVDPEFKRFAEVRGYTFDHSEYKITIEPPQNFQAYRQIELDTSRLANMASAVQFPFLSKRFCMMRFGGLTPEEVSQNERLYLEETKGIAQGDEEQDIGLRNVGIRPVSQNNEVDNINIDVAEPNFSELGGNETFFSTTNMDEQSQ